MTRKECEHKDDQNSDRNDDQRRGRRKTSQKGRDEITDVALIQQHTHTNLMEFDVPRTYRECKYRMEAVNSRSKNFLLPRLTCECNDRQR